MKTSFEGQVAMTLAKRPIASARQSKNMWIAVRKEDGMSQLLSEREKKGERRTVRDEAEAVGPDAVRHLNKHVGEVQAQEEVDTPRLG